MRWKDECGVFAIWNHPEAARLTFLGLYALQHRGQESAGIVTLADDGTHLHHKGIGLVSDVFTEAHLSPLHGFAALGHVRYATTGKNLLTNAQPLTAEIKGHPMALAHNGNLVNSDSLRKELRDHGAIFQGTTDTEILLHLMAHRSQEGLIPALEKSLQKIVGAYSMGILTQDSLIALRDPMGFRPLALGEMTNPLGEKAYVIASESCAFDLMGAKFIRELDQGEMLIINKDGVHSRRFAEKARSASCVFEYIYFSRADSAVFGRSVYESRKKFGKQLALESDVDADLVIPIPDSGIAAALGFSEQSKVPFDFGIIRNHYVGRTFIQPVQAVRDFGVRIKLNPQSHLLRGKKVVVVDDSLVRGTTSKKIVSLLKQAGAKEVHLRIASPPTIGPCFYGVDTPRKSQLIAANSSVEEIRRFVEADSLAYLSLDGLYKVLQADRKDFCSACFDGQYPTILGEHLSEHLNELHTI
ncbi:MAG: amidophosphoribosyltransferase [Bdellovibrionota bacterium]